AATGALPGSTAYSLVEQYRQVYGKTPAVAGVRLGDAPAITPVAAIALGARPKAIVAGDQVTVEARFVDPATGTTLEPGRRAVRYEPPARVTATLSQGQAADPAKDLTITLESAGYGVYRGVATPRRAGNWSLGVTAEWPD